MRYFHTRRNRERKPATSQRKKIRRSDKIIGTTYCFINILCVPLGCVPPIGGAFVDRNLGGFKKRRSKSSPTGRVSHAPVVVHPCYDLRAWAFLLASFRVSSKNLGQCKGPTARFFQLSADSINLN